MSALQRLAAAVSYKNSRNNTPRPAQALFSSQQCHTHTRNDGPLTPCINAPHAHTQLAVALEEKRLASDRASALDRRCNATEEENRRLREENARLRDELQFLRGEVRQHAAC